MGALPYLLKEMDVPVYGTRLTLGLVNGKLGEHGLQGKVTLNEVSTGKNLALGPFKIEFLEVCHSIPDGVGLGIHTPVGRGRPHRRFQAGPDPHRLPGHRHAALRGTWATRACCC